MKRADAIDALAATCDARRDEIVRVVSDETALTTAEQAPEFDRMVGTLRMFADVVREGSWVRAAIDRKAAAGRSVGPGHDVRSMLMPLGPVAVFGASNFPLAYGVLGGDTASAIAAGCPVVVKEHPAHPRTGRLLASLAREATASLVPGLVGYVLNADAKDYAVAAELVQHPEIKAVGFTGSVGGGLALEKLARERAAPIPVFAEMGSVNAVFVTPGALRVRAEAIADEVADSIFLRFGQQCTKAGVVFFEDRGDGAERFVSRLRERFERGPSRDMLTADIRKKYNEGTSAIEDDERAGLWALSDGEPIVLRDRGAQSHVWGTTLDEFIESKALQTEVFGPSVVLVTMAAWADSARVPRDGRLVVSVYLDETDASDVERVRALMDMHGGSAGRIAFNTVPTGVRVATGMVHGGPYSSSNAPHTTAVGPRAMERWCRPVCFQNCPSELLPAELRDGNPRGIWRTVEGEMGRT